MGLNTPFFFSLFLPNVIFLKRATETIKTRQYRYTKKNPKAQKAIFKIDRGNVEQIISLTFPKQTQLKSIEIPKEKNPNLVMLHLGSLKIACYINTPLFQMNKEKKTQINKLFKECGISKKVENLALSRKYQFEKGLLYDSDGNFSGTFLLHDLKNLYSEIGRFIKDIEVC